MFRPRGLTELSRCTALALACAALLATGAAPAVAQDDSNEVVVAGLSAGIATGTCDDPAAQPLYELFPFEAGFLEDDDSSSERVGGESAAAMLTSSTELEVTIDDLYAEPHAIVVADDAGQPIACGEIGGYLADDALLVGVRPLEGAGLAGFATLWDDRDAVEVELHLAEEVVAQAAPAGEEGDG